MATDDEEARKKRAEDLRSSLKKLEKGKKPLGAPTPRETTDEAARKARDDARSGSTPNNDRNEE